MTENLFYIYFGAAPLVILALAYIAMRAFGYGDRKNSHNGTPAE